MLTQPSSPTALPGDLAQLVSPSNKVFLIRLAVDGVLHTHRGIIAFNDLGQPGLQPFGRLVFHAPALPG